MWSLIRCNLTRCVSVFSKRWCDQAPHVSTILAKSITSPALLVFFSYCTLLLLLGTGFAELNPEIKRAGGKVVALSSQTPKQVNRTAAELKLPFQAFGDPSNELVTEMNRR